MKRTSEVIAVAETSPELGASEHESGRSVKMMFEIGY